jgi:Tol biopolymer transport system component
MRRPPPTRTITIAVLLFLCTTVLVTAQQSAADLFRQGSAREQIGDCEGAIPIYERIVRDFASARDREQVARAKLHLGDCWMKKTEADQAKGLALLNDVIDNYNYPDLANEARRLTALIRPAASPGTPLQIATAFTEDVFSFAISPDGRSLVVQSTAEDGKKQLWLQPVDGSRKPLPIAGTEGAGQNALPFFSPDGKSLGFFADGKLKRVSVSGGIPKDLAVGTIFRGGTWNKNDVIVFGTEANVLYSIHADGSGLKAVTTNAGTAQTSPKFLPDGSRFLFVVANNAEAILSMGALDNVSHSAIQPRDAQAAAFVAPDRMVYLSGGALMAQRLDLLKSQSIGAPVPLSAEVVLNRMWPGIAALSVSDSGPVAYRTATDAYRQFSLVDRTGRPIRTVGSPDKDSPSTARISPDGRSVLFHRRSGHAAIGSMWLQDIAGGGPRLLSVAASSAVWSPDSAHMVFAEFVSDARPPVMDLIDRTNKEGRYLERRSRSVRADDWSSKGFLLYETGASAAAPRDLMALPYQGGEPVAVTQTPFRERNGRFSPSGDWVAYQSDEMGARDEVFVQPFPGSTNSRTRVSANGGSLPRWSPDGLQLYFLSADNHLMVVPAPRSADGQDNVLGPAKSLFPLPSGSEFEVVGEESFLINAPIESAPPIFVLSNWTDKLPAVSSSSTASPLIVPAPLGRPTGYGDQTQIVAFDRQGQILSTIKETGPTPRLAISPDGTRVAYVRSGSIWVHDIAANSENPIVSNVLTAAPAWSPNGGRIAYLATRNGVQGVYVKPADGAGKEELLYAPVTALFNWSKDERFLAIETGNNFAVLPVDGDRKPVSIMPTIARSFGMRLAPDSRLVMYLSNESGRAEVYVRTFDPAPGVQQGTFAPMKISTQGSSGLMRWNAEGNELYFLASDGALMAVSVATAATFGEPTLHFRSPDNFPLAGSPGLSADISADGQRFVFALPASTN